MFRLASSLLGTLRGATPPAASPPSPGASRRAAATHFRKGNSGPEEPGRDLQTPNPSKIMGTVDYTYYEGNSFKLHFHASKSTILVDPW
jgi:hypothetical protein